MFLINRFTLSGDLLMALSWSMTTGFNTPITYFYPAYFLVLLVHRQMRDDENCHKKSVDIQCVFVSYVDVYGTAYCRYGKDWDTYKKLVPWRIIPYVY